MLMVILDTRFSLLQGKHLEQVFWRKTEKYIRYDCLVVLCVSKHRIKMLVMILKGEICIFIYVNEGTIAVVNLFLLFGYS